jgi:hypothetical protein
MYAVDCPSSTRRGVVLARNLGISKLELRVGAHKRRNNANKHALKQMSPVLKTQLIITCKNNTVAFF